MADEIRDEVAPDLQDAPAPAVEAPAAEAPAAEAAPPPPPQSETRRPPQKRFQRRKVCTFCVDKIDYVDYKDVKRLRKFVTERGKILPRRISGTCAPHQRMITVAVKRARNIALLPFKAE